MSSRKTMKNVRKTRKAMKICKICGDTAWSFNFNAITCESCKAFFRRNAFKSKNLKCEFDDKCEINIVTRRFCQKCRLQKCLDAGMKKSWILSEEEKRERSFKIKYRRGLNLSEADISVSSPSVEYKDPSSGLTSYSNDSKVFHEDSHQESPMLYAIEFEFNRTIFDTPDNNTPSPNGILNLKELSRLQELFVASRYLEEPLDPTTSNPSNLISLINLTDLAIKRIIKMTKGISPFNKLCKEDQIALLKGGCSELMILKSVKNFDPDRNSWRLPSVKRELRCDMNVLKEASQLGIDLYEEHQKFVRSFDPRWRTDESILLLLSAIALFTPGRPNVIHRDVVKLEQDTYYYLLRRYLETLYDGVGCEARSAYLSLIDKLLDLRHLNEAHLQVFLEVNPDQVEPLLIEIFDLSTK